MSSIARTDCSNACGFELYESSITVTPFAKRISSPRIFDGSDVASLEAICSGAAPK